MKNKIDETNTEKSSKKKEKHMTKSRNKKENRTEILKANRPVPYVFIALFIIQVWRLASRCTKKTHTQNIHS